MKRYRVIQHDFDSRPLILNLEIQDSWDPAAMASWETNKRRIKEGLVAEYGCADYHRKIEDFCSLGPAPFSVIAFHNEFYRQARAAFVCGAYYPCLTAICALGERVLNQLVLELRQDFRSTPEYKRVYRKVRVHDH